MVKTSIVPAFRGLDGLENDLESVNAVYTASEGHFA